jgi:PEP-CTERM motif
MRRTLWIMLAVLLVAIGAPNAHADTISTFDVSGTASADAGQSCGASCPFSGTLAVDVTSGAVTALDITFPGLAPFTTAGLFLSTGIVSTSNWVLEVSNSTNDGLFLQFTTTMTPGSLVDFTGGSIFGLEVTGPPGNEPILTISSGSISPATTATPEPSSVALMLLGVGSVFVMRKRIGQGLPQAS